LYSALTVGWGIPAIGLTLTLALTGVSFRFGDVCHVNHKLALQNFWGPLLAFAALGLVLQFITIGYCIQVYLKSLADDKNTTNSSGRAPTYSGSISTASARQTYRRVKRVISLQWRGATIVLVIIGEVAFFAVVFVSMDNSSQVSEQLLKKSAPWLTCLMLSQGDKNQCLSLVGDMVKPEGIVLAVLITLGVRHAWLPVQT
jgi:TRAP-type C4-dicarboxylate transport system permease large subunit